MRAFLAALFVCLFAFGFSGSASAGYVWGYGVSHSNHSHARPQSRGDGNCDYWIARGLGCGCTVARLLGLPWNYKGLNLRMAAVWFAFPHTSAHVGAVAIWTYPHAHVELVSAVHGNTFDSRGTVNFRGVPLQRVTFVDVR